MTASPLGMALRFAAASVAGEIEIAVVDGPLLPGRAATIEVAVIGVDGSAAKVLPEQRITGATVRGTTFARPGVWRTTVVPSMDGDAVVVEVLGVERSFPSAPPGPSSLVVPALVDAEVGAHPIEVLVTSDGPLPVDALEIATSEGNLNDLREVDGGVAVTLLPTDLAVPRFVLVGVRDRRRSEQPAWSVVQLKARPRLPIEAEPGAAVAIEVGPRRYGPYAVDARGRLEARIEQLPGERVAVAVLTDDLGNTTRTEIPLATQPGHALLVVPSGEVHPGNPPPVVHVRAIGANGDPPTEAPSCSTPAASLPIREAAEGAWFMSLPPAESAEDVRVACTLGETTAFARVPAVAGVAFALGLRVWPADLTADFPVAEVRYVLEDVRGEQLPVDAVEVTARHGAVMILERGGPVGRGEYDGRGAIEAGSDTVHATWRAPHGDGQLEDIALAWMPFPGDRLQLSARALDRFRRPLTGVPLVLSVGDAVGEATTGPDGWATLVFPRAPRAIAIAHARGAFRSATALVPPGDTGRAGPGEPDLAVSREIVVRPGRVAGLSVDVDPTLLRAGPGAVAWVTVKLADGAGQPITDEPIAIEATEGQVGALQSRPDGSFVAEYTPLPIDSPREVVLTARTETLYTSTRLMLEPRLVRISVGPWLGGTTNFGKVHGPIGGIDLDLRTRSRLVGEALMIRFGVAVTSFSEDTIPVGASGQMEWTSTLVPGTVGLLFRDDRGPVGLWTGAGFMGGIHHLRVTTGGSPLATTDRFVAGPVLFAGASRRAFGGEALLTVRASWLPVSQEDVGYEGNLGGLAAGVGYRLLY